MYKCKYCNKEFEKSYQLAAHVSMCKLNPNYKQNIQKHKIKKTKEELKESRIKINPYKYLKKERKLICQHCGKEYTLNLTDKEFEQNKYSKFCSRSCANSRGPRSQETKDKISKSVQQISYKYKQNKKIYICYCKHCGKEMIFEGCHNHHLYCSKECKHNELSLKRGGFRQGSVKNYKYGWYKGIYCDSSWELAFVIYHLDHQLFIERCKFYKEYNFNNKIYKYYPDFITNDGIFEIKGYTTEQSEAKRLQNPDVKYLYKNDMKKYLDYVINTYGKDFVKLYGTK